MTTKKKAKKKLTDRDIVENHIDYINNEWPHQCLRRKTKIRERVGEVDVGKSVLTYLWNNADCVEKYYYGTTRGAFHYFAPIGFNEFIQNLVKSEREIETMLDNLNKD
ncbi:hypothetical protein J7J47_03750 [Halomonas sp. ISL-60]|uniref:hypothetical protein n=1 Tax=Halomonas sp. ISL-56 TaxID=2819149 RepID=UPI001BE5C9FA|nr:hypothetical protein [Halomonas sp. ISL-56]MBT2771344.1 hypothetical protein [Halomonas sp. ISL-60]MBT2800701.1 hypothetical protein [Halomonas sp. ISL-56]